MKADLWPRHWGQQHGGYVAGCLGGGPGLSCGAESDECGAAADVDGWMIRHATQTGHQRYQVSSFAVHDVRTMAQRITRTGLGATGRLALVLLLQRADRGWARVLARSLDRLQAAGTASHRRGRKTHQDASR